ncbi:hypothetical protein SS50377_21483 [Spironucleus salmonicida]|uniref:Uncharacterized protein n=1 Tax=Spironucleus salmonicida TaxID=348837 RepID=V6LPT8_9EUKA|nr:hypothetical protein SS50377_21483 [Spironucleus salmonicida]|eukprot:EST46677.1 Hypothetical protein SS50377_13308 [Spironucleus salmonicida]
MNQNYFDDPKTPKQQRAAVRLLQRKSFTTIPQILPNMSTGKKLRCGLPKVLSMRDFDEQISAPSTPHTTAKLRPLGANVTDGLDEEFGQLEALVSPLQKFLPKPRRQ